jgi:cysteine desulfurase
MIKQLVYLDNAASTRVDDRVIQAMLPYLTEIYTVPTSEFAYSLGIRAREALEKARSAIAETISADAEEIVFTSDITDSVNLAVRGALKTAPSKKNHIITSKIEDFPVLNTFKSLSKEGYEVTFLEVDEYGRVDPEDVKRAIRETTALVSIQHANQEIGTVQPVEEIARICKEKGVLFHTDATHTYRRVSIDVCEVPIDLISFSSHTIHGPKGAAALYIRKGLKLKSVLSGGYQEKGLRPGFDNVAAAVGFAEPARLVTDEENEKIKKLRDKLVFHVLNEVEDTVLNGHPKVRIPQNANITFRYVEGESITLHLDFRGIAVSTGSACFSKSLEASHVILGIHGDHERAHGSVRFTFSRFNSEDEVDYVVNSVKEVVKRLREISPLKKGGEL